MLKQADLEDVEAKLQNIKDIREKVDSLLIFINTVEVLKEKLVQIDQELEEINKKIKSFDLVDFLYDNQTNFMNMNLNVVNTLLQDVKLASLDFTGNDEYLEKSVNITSKIIQGGIKIVKDLCKKNIELLYLNNNFIVFTTLLEDNHNEFVKIMVLRNRKLECVKKISFYKGDLDIFYKLMVKQEMYIYSKIFSKDFMKILENLRKYDTTVEFTLFEKFIYSIFISFFEKVKDLENLKEELLKKLSSKICEEVKLANADFFSYPHETQDWFYESLIYKCCKEYINDGIVEL